MHLGYNIMNKGEKAVWIYLEARERHGNKQGYYRCEKELKDSDKCLKQCTECNEYYDKRLKEK